MHLQFCLFLLRFDQSALGLVSLELSWLDWPYLVQHSQNHIYLKIHHIVLFIFFSFLYFGLPLRYFVLVVLSIFAVKLFSLTRKSRIMNYEVFMLQKSIWNQSLLKEHYVTFHNVGEFLNFTNFLLEMVASCWENFFGANIFALIEDMKRTTTLFHTTS